MTGLRGVAFLGTVVALTLSGGEIFAQEVTPESSLAIHPRSNSESILPSISTASDSPLNTSEPQESGLELSQNGVQSQPLDEINHQVTLQPFESTLLSQVQVQSPAQLTVETQPQKEPQPLSELETTSPSTTAADLNNNQVNPVEWSLAENVQVAQQQREEKPEDPRKAADSRGRRLSNNYNYIGIGGNIGITGDASGLGNGGVITMSKGGFSENLSFHSAGVVVGEDGGSWIALTADFPVRTQTGSVSFAPFIGAGVIYKDLLNKDFSFGPAATVGIDIPISYSFLITSRASVGYIREETDFGFHVGFAYIYTKGLLDLIF